MVPRAGELVRDLALAPHPEGGHFREIHRAADTVAPADGRGERAALTVIHFLLAGGDVSRWHRVASDEVWQHVEGAPLELWTGGADFEVVTCAALGPLADGGEPVRVVPAGTWQAARSTGAYTLVACTVGPGFDFADFELLEVGGALAERVAREHPEVGHFV